MGTSPDTIYGGGGLPQKSQLSLAIFRLHINFCTRTQGKFLFRILILVENTRIVSIPNFRMDIFPVYEFFEKNLQVFPEKTQICLKNLKNQPFYEFFEKNLRVFPEKSQICLKNLKNLTFFSRKLKISKI
eukprot:sb/3475192/